MVRRRIFGQRPRRQHTTHDPEVLSRLRLIHELDAFDDTYLGFVHGTFADGVRQDLAWLVRAGARVSELSSQTVTPLPLSSIR